MGILIELSDVMALLIGMQTRNFVPDDLADTRDIDEERRNVVMEKIHQSAIRIAKDRGVKLAEFKIVNQDPPAHSDELVIRAMESASKDLKLSHKLMISRAYHDSLFMAR